MRGGAYRQIAACSSQANPSHGITPGGWGVGGGRCVLGWVVVGQEEKGSFRTKTRVHWGLERAWGNTEVIIQEI